MQPARRRPQIILRIFRAHPRTRLGVAPWPARPRTRSGRANVIAPTQLFTADGASFGQAGLLQQISNAPFRTPVFGFDYRFRGVNGARMVVFMNDADIEDLGFQADEFIDMTTAMDTDVVRRARGFQFAPYPVRRGCIGAHFPHAMALAPVRLTRSAIAEQPQPEEMRR